MQKKMVLVVMGIALMMMTVRAESKSKSIKLVRRGRPAATIVLADQPTRAAQFAAAELQHHIGKITGAKLPIARDEDKIKGTRILVGESKATLALSLRNKDFKHQEYLIRFLPDTLILMGRDKEDKRPMDYANPETFPGYRDWVHKGVHYFKSITDEQATCYAVYDFLERFCGVRWYLPTDLGLVCPKEKTLVVKGADVRRSPAMKFREINRAADMPADLSDFSGPILPWRERALFLYRQRLTGVQPYAFNHSFYGYYRRYLKDHPDWFAKGYDKDMPENRGFAMKGETYDSTGYPMKYYPNMCYTSKGFIQQVIKSARHYFDTGKTLGGEKAKGDYFSLVPMDSTGKDKFCLCPECQALLHKEPPCNKWRKQYFFFDDQASDYIYGFVNKVAKEVGKTHPDKYLTISTYHQHYYPPTREPLEPNVSILFPIHAQLRAVPAMDRAINDLLNKWGEESREHHRYLALWFHRPGRANPFFPGFMAHNMVKQMKDYHKFGFRGIFAEPAYLPKGKMKKGYARRAPIVNLLELYVAFKLADDPTLDGNKLIDEFFTLFYDGAARPMQALYEKIEQVYCDPANYSFDPNYFGYQKEEIAWGKLGTKERMTEFGKLMEEAKTAAKTEMEKKRVALFEKSVWQRMKAGQKEYLKSKSMREKLPLQSGRAVRITGAAPDGDLGKVDWSKAEVLGNWSSLLEGKTTDRKLEARMFHDGKYLYMQLQEIMDSNTPAFADGKEWWQICIGRGRSHPYRDMWVNSKAKHVDKTIGGESIEWNSGAVVLSDVKSLPDRWQVQIALPLAKLLPGKAQPGDKICVNIIRYSPVKSRLAWNPTFTDNGYEPLRLGDITLAQ